MEICKHKTFEEIMNEKLHNYISAIYDEYYMNVKLFII